MRLSKRPPLHRELREDREEDRGRPSVLLPKPHHQISEPRATEIDSVNVCPRSTSKLYHPPADTHGFSCSYSWMPSLHIFKELPHRFEFGRLDASYWFSRSEPKLSFRLVHGEEPPELAGKHMPTAGGEEVTKVTVTGSVASFCLFPKAGLGEISDAFVDSVEAVGLGAQRESRCQWLRRQHPRVF